MTIPPGYFVLLEVIKNCLSRRCEEVVILVLKNKRVAMLPEYALAHISVEDRAVLHQILYPNVLRIFIVHKVSILLHDILQVDFTVDWYCYK